MESDYLHNSKIPHCKHFNPEDGGNMFLRNFCVRLAKLHGDTTQNVSQYNGGIPVSQSENHGFKPHSCEGYLD
jgi:hypothetical protein